VVVCQSFVHSSYNNINPNMARNNEVGHGVDIWLKDLSDGSMHSDGTGAV